MTRSIEREQLQFNLNELKKLHEDLEKQLIKFDEIIPYERQTTAKIFSPRLLNMMLSCCPQIESITKLIASRVNMELTELDENKKSRSRSVPSLIREINKNAILSNLHIETKTHKLLFTPFTKNLEWWQKYAELKHGLATKQREIDYTTVMNAFSALASLHYVANKAVNSFDDKAKFVLDKQNWHKPIGIKFKADDYGEVREISRYPWVSLVFGIKHYFAYF